MIPKEILKDQYIEIRTATGHDLFSGEYHSTFKVRNEFEEVREYQPGMTSPDRLNVTARTGFPRKEVPRRAGFRVLLVDASSSGRFGTRTGSRASAASCGSAGLLCDQNSISRLIIFTDRIENSCRQEDSSAPLILKCSFPAAGSSTTRMALSIQQVIKRKSCVPGLDFFFEGYTKPCSG